MLTPSEATAILECGLLDADGTWIRVIETRGFGGREAGEGLVLARDGTRLGGLLHGVLDLDLLRLVDQLVNDAREALTAGISVRDQQAIDAGFVCGGEVEVLAQRLRSVPEALWRAVEAGRPATVITVCSGMAAGVTAVVDDTGLHGDERLAELGVGEVLAHHAGLVGARARQRMLTVADQRVLLEVVIPRVQLVVLGGGELASALSAQGEQLGWSVSTVDRLDLALDAVSGLGSNDALVVLTHLSHLDTPVLAKALLHGVGFVGALGSRQTQVERATRLLSQKVPPELISNVHGPAGLDLGAASPAETAVAVVAEILLARSARSGLPLRDTSGRINA